MHRLPLRNTSGLTRVGLLAGTVVVSLVLSSAGWAVSDPTGGAGLRTEDPIDAALVAREIYDLALQQSTVADGSLPAKDGAGVAGLDSLDGASFGPPLNAAGRPLALLNAPAWRQDVDVQVFSLLDLDTPVSQSFASAARSSTTLYRLTVHVTCHGQNQGTWWWWLYP
jgi:hypothetical protein